MTFSFTPFGDPYFAAVAARRGFMPKHIEWKIAADGAEEATISIDAPADVPSFSYHCRTRRRWDGDHVAHLVIYMPTHNYFRTDDARGLTLHHVVLPDTVLAALPGTATAKVIDDPLLRGTTVLAVDRIDEERRQIMLAIGDAIPAG